MSRAPLVYLEQVLVLSRRRTFFFVSTAQMNRKCFWMCFNWDQYAQHISYNNNNYYYFYCFIYLKCDLHSNDVKKNLNDDNIISAPTFSFSMKSTKLVLSISTGWPWRSYRARTKWKKLDFRRLEGGCFSKWARARPTPLWTQRRGRVVVRLMKTFFYSALNKYELITKVNPCFNLIVLAKMWDLFDQTFIIIFLN